MAASRVQDCVNAAVDALKADVDLQTLLGGQKSYTNVPQGTDTPYTLVMGGDEVPWTVTFAMDDDGDNGGRQVDVIVQCVSVHRGSGQVDRIASRVTEVLTDAATWAAVVGFQLAEFVRNQGNPPIDLNRDGNMYFVRNVTVRASLA